MKQRNWGPRYIIVQDRALKLCPAGNSNVLVMMLYEYQNYQAVESKLTDLAETAS